MSETSPFQQFSRLYRPMIEEALSQALSEVFDDARHDLQQALIYSTLNQKNKRVRPLLAMASQLLFSTHSDAILPFCSAIECVHTFSLIHDDLPALDDDDLRRGQASCHKQFGEATAILAGDLLLNHAFYLMSHGLQNAFDSTNIVKAIQHFTVAIGQSGMVGGQQLDLNPAADYDLASLQSIHSKKTGALIQSSLIIPALLCNASSESLAALTDYGHHLGLLFQITDDILDVISTAEALGKTPQKDMNQNKQTYVQLLGLDQAKDHARQHAFQAQQALSGLSGINTDVLLDFIGVILGREA